MTREEFISNGVAWHGSAVGWQSALARALDVDSRTIRRAVTDGPSDNLARALLDLIGDSAPVRVPAEWVCGDGSDGREYLIRLRPPRFLCLVLADEEYEAFEPKSGADYETDGQVLCAFQWIDRRPDNLTSILESACDALDEFTQRASL